MKHIIALLLVFSLCDLTLQSSKADAQSCGSTTANQNLANHCDITITRMINFQPSTSVTLNQMFRDAVLTSLTTTGTSGSATWNPSTGVLNIPQYTGTTYTAGTGINISGGNVISLPNIITAGTGGIVTIDATGRITSFKRQETYRGTTNASGLYTVTYANAFSVAPTVVPSFITTDPRDVAMVISSTTTGFTIQVQRRVDVVGLLPSYSNRASVTVDVNVNEQ